jgi:transglutaminase-like putative cysteine protease
MTVRNGGLTPHRDSALLALACGLVVGAAPAVFATSAATAASTASIASVRGEPVEPRPQGTGSTGSLRTGKELPEEELARRIALDFPHSQADVREQLRRDIPDLTDEEFVRWDVPTLLESTTVGGRKRYFHNAVPNLYRVSAEARARRRTPWQASDGPMETANAHHLEVVEGRHDSRRVRVTQQLIVNADAVPAGETVRAWIPFPREIEGQQENIRLLSTTPAPHVLASPGTKQRTVAMEAPAQTGQPTVFAVSYELTILGRHHTIVPEKVVPVADLSALADDLAERPPHIVFTPELRAYSKKIVGNEKNPARVAKKLFDAVDSIPWGSAREYSTIPNISDYAFKQGHADCGQQTLLLITLLRMNGIPARWQSGMVFSDGSYDNLHDWGQLYLAPYGWVPMDVTTGALESEDPRVRDFYFGSSDAYRIAFNDDISTAFDPPKEHERSETVDSQRGEAEWKGGNLYFDQWDYRFEAKVLP